MRSFEITLFNQFGETIRHRLVVAMTRGAAFAQARLMMKPGVARFAVEEI